MKLSIKYKYTLVIVALLLFVLIAMQLYVNFGMEPYVNAQKRSSIKSTISQIEQCCDTGWNNDNARELTKNAGIRNLEILVYRSSGFWGNMVYRTSNSLESLQNRFASFLQTNTINADKIYESNDKFVLYRVFDGNMEGEQIECMGYHLDYYYVISTSLSGIIESVHTTSDFLLILGIFVVIIAIIVSIIIGFKFAKPIEKLAVQSDKISQLDFSYKYSGKSKDEIGVLGQNMNAMSDKLESTISMLEEDLAEKERINRSQIDFISNASHELKTPIAVIQGYAEGIRDGVAADKDSLNYYTSVIVEEAEHMNQIITRMLSLDEIESGKYNVNEEEFDIIKMIKGILESFQPQIEKKSVKIKLRAPESVMVYTDEFLIERTVINYINNAYRHCSEPGEITICVHKLDDCANVIVENTGDRIPEEDLPRIWDKFYKVDKSHTRTNSGSGIGMSIVKRVMQQLGGDYFVYNTDNGVAFGISIKDSRSQNHESEEIFQ